MPTVHVREKREAISNRLVAKGTKKNGGRGLTTKEDDNSYSRFAMGCVPFNQLKITQVPPKGHGKIRPCRQALLTGFSFNQLKITQAPPKGHGKFRPGRQVLLIEFCPECQMEHRQ